MRLKHRSVHLKLTCLNQLHLLHGRKARGTQKPFSFHCYLKQIRGTMGLDPKEMDLTCSSFSAEQGTHLMGNRSHVLG